MNILIYMHRSLSTMRRIIYDNHKLSRCIVILPSGFCHRLGFDGKDYPTQARLHSIRV